MGMAVRVNGKPLQGKSIDLQTSLSRDAQSNETESPKVYSSNDSLARDGSDSMPEGKPQSCKEKIDRSQIATIDEIYKSKKDGMSKMSLGDGLQVHFENNEKMSFHFRLSENGRDTTRKLGDSKSMSLEQARHAAKTYRDKVLQERAQRLNVAFQGMLKIPRTNSTPIHSVRNVRTNYRCFSSMKDAGNFLNYLFSDNGIDEQIKYALHFLLLTPVVPRELFRATWDDLVVPNELSISRDRSEANNRGTYQTLKRIAITVVLSKQAAFAINKLKNLSRDIYILPRFGRNYPYSETVLNNYMQDIFPGYRIRPTDFIQFFRDMAVHNSGFSEEFIDNMITFGNMPKAYLSNDPQIPRRLALLNWWGDELNSARNAPTS